MAIHMSNDQDLLHGAKQFDLPALTTIYEQYSPMIYRYAYRLLGDASLAEECLADTFDRFLHALSRGAGPKTNLKAYLYRIAHNWITDRFRSNRPAESEIPEEIQDERADRPDEVTRALDRETLRNALQQLTPDQQQVIVLKYVEEFDNDEISKILQKNVGSVKALQHRALASLRRLLVDELK